jgi:hypothetical protein
MRKLKYQGGLTKLIASRVGNKNKRRFGANIGEACSLILGHLKSEPIDMDVVSFSSNRDFYDQLLSILSFLRYVGMPSSWTLYSDGTHTSEQVGVLEELEFVQVRKTDWQYGEGLRASCTPKLQPYAEALADYALKYPLGKKLYVYLNHAVKRPTLFLDADILFYGKASVFRSVLNDGSKGWYLPDCEWGNLDSRYKSNNKEEPYQINSGFFLLKQDIEKLDEGLRFLQDLNFEYEYFSEQNVFHILFRSNGYMPLDPRLFVLNSADQFDFSYSYERESIAMRHYTGPVRHKMWQRDWKWQLLIS